MAQRSSTKGHLMSPGGSSAQAGPQAESTRRQVYQWSAEHGSDMDAANYQQTASQLAAHDSSVLQQTTAHVQDVVLNQSNAAMDDKLSETERQKATADQALAESEAEFANLSASADKTRAALESKAAPIEAVNQWLLTRAERPISEKLRDGVEISLNTLLAALHESVALLTATYGAQNNELGRLQVAIAAIQADIRDKEAALQIDSDTRNLTTGAPTTPNAMLGTVKPPFDPQQW